VKTKNNITATLFLQLLFLIGAAQNNELKFTLVQDPNGKSLGKINAITQDPHGYMWFAGNGENCIYRYDGIRMISFRHDEANPNSLGIDNPETVYADKKGMIWIGQNGLDKYDPATGIFKHYRHSENDPGSLAADDVFAILEDNQGRLWVGGGSGLDRLDEKTNKFFHYHNIPGDPKSLSNNVVRAIYEDHQGVIWISTGSPFFPPDKPNDDGGLNRLNPDGTFTRYLHDPNDPHSLINNKVKAIFEDSRGVFWVGTSGDGLHTMDRTTGSFERHLYDPSKPDQLSRPPVKDAADHIIFINEDKSGAIWIGTYKAGINHYDPVTKKITHYQTSNEAADSTCWNDFISKDGVLWIATENSHLLYRVDPLCKPINSISTGRPATSFLEDKEGYLWVGSMGNGLFKYDQHKNLVHQFKHDPSDSFSLLNNNVTIQFQGASDTIWVRTGKGLRMLNRLTQQFSWFHDGDNLKDSTGFGITKIIRDEQGFTWFGIWGAGLVRYDPKDNSFKHFLSDAQDSSSIASNHVNIIFEDRSGTLWAGGPGGLNRLNKTTGRFKHYMRGNFINSLYEDSGGNFLAGTEHGLFRYDPEKDQFSTFFDPQAQINSFTIGGITEDNEKNLWLSSQLGIIKLNPVTKETFIYAGRFGIDPASLVLWGPAYKNKKGEIFISHESGFYTFSPEELAVKTNFKITLTDLFINTLAVLPGKGSIIQNPIEEINDLDLKYNQNNIAFDFAAIDYRKPEATKYFTMLENYDNTWREAIGEKSSYYFNVSPGKYIYRVKAYNSDGTKAERAITIQINPPWWETWWAYALYALLLIVSVWAFIRRRTSALQKEKIILEKKVAERTKELKEEKEVVETTLAELKSTQAQLMVEKEAKLLADFNQKFSESELKALRAQMNPHFVFNILNTIESYALDNNKEAASVMIQKFSRLTRMVLENSMHQLVPFQNDLKSLQLYIELEQMRYADKFMVQYNIQEQIMEEDYLIPPMIIQPFVENAIIHGLRNKSDDSGVLNLSADLKNGYIIVNIEDNGIGRMKAAALKANNPIQKNSLGIKVTQDRISIFNNLNQNKKANVEIKDLHEGTKVVICLPATN